MAIVTVDLVGQCLTGTQKLDLIHHVTDAVEHIVGPAMREMITVRINELPDGHYAVGGKPVTAEQLYKQCTLTVVETAEQARA